mmetsp:Transcript_15502/g.32097  ORF Transcript_15502/g.32097 Transcript_15502/m.32097 type:complete len:225 (-) Transcript_15502:216-890(-)
MHVTGRIESRQFLPLLETAQSGSLSHAFANDRPGNLDVFLIDHFPNFFHVGGRVDPQVFSHQAFQLFCLVLLPAAPDKGIVNLAVFVPAGIRRSVQLGLNVSPFLAHLGHQTNEPLNFGVRPGTPLKGMELAESVPIYGLNWPIRKALGDFHPRALEVCLVVAFAAETDNTNLFRVAVFLDGKNDRFGFFLCVLARSHCHCGFALSKAVLVPLVFVGIRGTIRR